MLTAGDRAPSFTLPDTATGEGVSDPWSAGATALVFFKVTCPVCHMVAPKVAALATGGVRVVGVGEDPPPALVRYAAEKGQRVPTLSEAAPYPVSSAFGISSVPSLFVVCDDGVITHAVGGWDRERWNEAATALGAKPVSDETDGLPSFRPG